MSENSIKFTNRKASRAENTKGRKEEWVPAVVYGPKQTSTPIFVDNKFFVINGTKEDNTVYTLAGDAELNGTKVMIKNVQKNPTVNQVLHVDFYAPDMTQTVKVEVPLDFQGTPEGVANGGVVQTIRRAIEIECLPTEIPESIPVDVSGLKLNDTLKMGDVVVPSQFKIISAPEYAVMTVAEVKAEAETPAGEAPAAEGGEAPAADAAEAPKAE